MSKVSLISLAGGSESDVAIHGTSHVKYATSAPIIASDRERDILKGQCLNIVFNAYFKDCGIDFDANREAAIMLAQKLFVELESADYYNW